MITFKIGYVTKAGVTGVMFIEALHMQAAFEDFCHMRLNCTMITIMDVSTHVEKEKS